MATTKQILGKVTITPKGEYQADIEYKRLDIVTFNGSSYIAKIDNTNVPVTNTDTWLKLVEKPIKGTDYFTEEDIDSMVSEVTENSESAFNEFYDGKIEEFNKNSTEKTESFDKNYNDKLESFNTNASSKTTDFDTNATTKTKAYDTNADSKLKTYNDNHDEKVSAFDNEVETATTTFNTNAETLTNSFNTNATEKTTTFNDNVSSSTKAFNDNVNQATTTFNDNAVEKTTTFDNNATTKTDEFNTNAQEKTDAFNENASSINDKLSNLEDVQDEIVPKQTAVDNIININDALKYKNFEFKVDGNYEQATTTGQQLYNVKDKSETYNGITVDDDDWITINIDNTSGSSSIYANYYTNNLNLKPNTNYNVFLEVKGISGEGNLRIISCFYQDEVQNEGQFITYWNCDLTQLQSNKIYNKIATTVSEEIMQNIKNDGLRTFIEVPAGQSISITFRISVIEDTTKTVDNFIYEPYTGELASPNPDYPQEITQLSFDKIMTSGQNLFDLDDVEQVANNEKITTNVDDDGFIHVDIDNTGYSSEVFANYWTNISKNLITNHDYLGIIEVKEYSGSGYNCFVGTENVSQFKTDIIYYNQNPGIFIKKITTKDSFTNTYTMLRSFIECPANSKVSITYRISILADLTVNQENFVYKPYKAIDYSINLQGNEMVALPNGVKDELQIDKEGNVSLVKKVGKILLNSVEKWNLIGDTENYWEYANYDLSDSAKYSYCLSNYFSSDEDNRLIYTLTQIYCRFPKSLGIDVSDTEKFKQWLSSNNVYGYYEKTTPQTISLGKLSDLITTEQGSNTFAINGNIDTQISTTYALDLKKYIDNKIATVSTAVIGE